MPQLLIETVDDPLTFERIESFGGGMDAFTRSTLLPPDTSQYLENCIVEQNLEARTRPGADALGAATVDGGGNATLQGLTYFDSPSMQRLLTAKGNTMKQWDGAAWTTASGYTVTNGGTFVAAQGIDKLLVTDGVQAPCTWDGTTFTSLGTNGPTGCNVLEFAYGSMLASGFPGTGGAGKERDAIWASALLDFSATGWLPQNSFRVGAGDGDPIMAISVLPTTVNLDFLLAVMKRNSVWMVEMNPPGQPIQWSILKSGPGVGIVGRRAYCQFGEDCLFFARDGVRSVRRMQSAAGQYELSAPISLPMQPYIDRINWAYASGIVTARYKELAMFAIPLDSATTNNTLLVFNGRLQKWVGVWTGWTPVGFSVSQFNGVAALNIADTTGRVNLWKDTANKASNGTYLDNGSAIPTKVWPRSMTFADMINPKDGYYAETRFTDGNAVVNISAVLDNVIARTWNANISPVGPILPVTLDFVLGSGAPSTTRRSLRGLNDFSECYLRLESASGWFSCRNITLAAFLNMLDNQ